MSIWLKNEKLKTKRNIRNWKKQQNTYKNSIDNRKRRICWNIKTKIVEIGVEIEEKLQHKYNTGG